LNQWNPVPRDMIALALCDLSRYEKGNPAPDVVGYVVAWHLLESGHEPSVRRLASDLGWGRTKAAKLLLRARSERQEWLERTSQQPQTDSASESGHSRPRRKPNAPPQTDAFSQQERTLSADNSLANTITSTPTVTKRVSTSAPNGTKSDARSSPVKATWDVLADEWQRLRPGGRRLKLTQARRKSLKSRLRESSSDDLVKALRWMLTSTHPRARFIQDNDYGIDTLLRAGKCSEYVELSSAPSLDAADRFIQRFEARELVSGGAGGSYEQ